MNELLDLPDLPPRTRPVPTDGLERAMQVGRKRRARFLGASGGGVGVVAVVLTLIALQPGVGRQSLGYANEGTPSAEPSVTASPGQGEATPAPVEPTEQPASPADESASPAADSSPGTSPANRPAYTESPQDVAVPPRLECVEPPTGHTGPLYYGNGRGDCGFSDGGPDHVKRGGSVRTTTGICSQHGSGNVVVDFATGREHDVQVFDGAGDLVYAFSRTVRYTEGAHRLIVADGRCAVWNGVWETTLTDGRLVPAGTYRVHVNMDAASINGQRTSGKGTLLEFSVQVS